MKSRLLSIAAVVLMLLVGSSALFAQGSIAPNGQFGIGVNTSGFQLQYAASPALQFGLLAMLRGTSQDSISATQYGIAPYVRFLLEGTVNPFFEAGFVYSSIWDNPFSEDDARSSLFLAFGLEYFITQNVGVFGHVSLFRMQLGRTTEVASISIEEPSTTQFGLFDPSLGVEWYFDR